MRSVAGLERRVSSVEGQTIEIDSIEEVRLDRQTTELSESLNNREVTVRIKQPTVTNLEAASMDPTPIASMPSETDFTRQETLFQSKIDHLQSKMILIDEIQVQMTSFRDEQNAKALEFKSQFSTIEDHLAKNQKQTLELFAQIEADKV